MEGTISLLSSRSSSYPPHSLTLSPPCPSGFHKIKAVNFMSNWRGEKRASARLFGPPRGVLRTPELSPEEVVVASMPKIDKSGKFCSPRAARELALLILYAACLEGSDPIRVFDRRVNARREPGYEFDKASLLEYNHISFGGPPVNTETIEQADELLRNDEKESTTEAEVLSAPPKLVYSKLVLRFARKLLAAVAEKWDSHVLVIDKVAPPNWKNEPASRILEFSILHLAMSEIAVVETRHQIVINEAVDLTKRFCEGSAPRIINGCLRTYVKDFSKTLTSGSAGRQELQVRS